MFILVNDMVSSMLAVGFPKIMKLIKIRNQLHWYKSWLTIGIDVTMVEVKRLLLMRDQCQIWYPRIYFLENKRIDYTEEKWDNERYHSLCHANWNWPTRIFSFFSLPQLNSQFSLSVFQHLIPSLFPEPNTYSFSFHSTKPEKNVVSVSFIFSYC